MKILDCEKCDDLYIPEDDNEKSPHYCYSCRLDMGI